MLELKETLKAILDQKQKASGSDSVPVSVAIESLPITITSNSINDASRSNLQSFPAPVDGSYIEPSVIPIQFIQVRFLILLKHVAIIRDLRSVVLLFGISIQKNGSIYLSLSYCVGE